MSENATLRYIHQDHNTGTSVVSDNGGASVSTIKYTPFGETRSFSGKDVTNKKFTGQRLDGTGLYYYNARYYDPEIGRFISADTFIPWSTGVDVVSSPLTVNIIPAGLGSLTSPRGNYPSFTLQAPVNPQNLNRYSYVVNTPLAYNDPNGWRTFSIGLSLKIDIGVTFSFGFSFAFDDKGNKAITYDTERGLVTDAGGEFWCCGY